MLVDRNNMVSRNQALTATAVSTDVVDMKVSADQFGAGAPQLFLMFVVGTTYASAGASTLVINIVDDDNTSLSSPTVLASSPSIPKASLVAGAKFAIPVPPLLAAPSNRQRYLGASFTVGTANFTAGDHDAWFTDQVPSADVVFYPDAVTYA